MEKKYYDEKDIIKGLKFAKRMNEFVSYVYDFYGKNGIYDMGATVSQIQTATIDYIASDDSLPFYGDSLDRERVRDILTSKFDLKFKLNFLIKISLTLSLSKLSPQKVPLLLI